MMCLNPTKRPSIQEVVKHSFFKGAAEIKKSDCKFITYMREEGAQKLKKYMEESNK